MLCFRCRLHSFSSFFLSQDLFYNFILLSVLCLSF
ncbi:hypothetical protein OIU74_022174 [Salix koriyanagi]|uniref:Uncharacterized protein n=1 Tax=Salix koriyanagi TaxID=2511006 RepID=A0A9Q0WJI1_9ROSI|nr:hypothetical protein OIU74_022174 [Salix koriyanagi]